MNTANTRLATAILAAACLSFTTTSYAVEETSASTTSTDVARKSLKDYMVISYLGVLLGPRLGDPGNIYQPDGITGANDAKIITKNYLDLLWKASPSLTVGPMIYWTFEPVAEKAFVMRDPAIKFKTTPFIKTDSMTLTADLRVGLPLSQDARDTDRLTYVASLQTFNYDVPQSRWSLGVLAWERAFFYGGQGEKDSTALEFWVGPNVSYRLSPTVQLTYIYDFNYKSSKRDRYKTLSDTPDMEAGVSWDVSSKLNLNPVIHIPNEGEITLNKTSLVAYVVWKPL
ncbi:hypothetical protein K2X30_15410 [bacterium]|jgi:hypothetical protein|nr:hypothetical protein [bacterium]